jgi:hypothetical protein
MSSVAIDQAPTIIYCSYTPKQKQHIYNYRDKNPDKIKEITKRYTDKKRAEKLAEHQQLENDRAKAEGREAITLTKIPRGRIKKSPEMKTD